MSEIFSAVQVVLYPPKLVGATITYGPGRLAERSFEVYAPFATGKLTRKTFVNPEPMP